MKRILALTRYGRDGASTRQRFLQFAPALAGGGFELRLAPMFDARHLAAIGENRPIPDLGLAASFWRRMRDLRYRQGADLLWVQYELFPFMPAIFERTAFLAGLPIVVDFDDAYFHRYDRHRLPIVRALLGRKMRPLIQGAAEIVAGNSYLADYARRWNDRVTIIPTVVDTDVYRPRPSEQHSTATIGWIGSPTTWRAYVWPHLGMLRQLCKETNARLLVVGAGHVPAEVRFPHMESRAWSEATEVTDIQDMDIGIMPLPDDPWARGKCGYKLIQYMACGLPTVASPVGINAEIVLPGKTGFLAEDDQAWREALTRLITDRALRRNLGRNGRERAVSLYSLESRTEAVLDVMRRALEWRKQS